MFTLEQIKAAHSKVRSGADFPVYVQALKALGMSAYEHDVADGHIRYEGRDGFALRSDSKWSVRAIAPQGNRAELSNALHVHQHGRTDYPTFCKEAAEAGVEKWVVDMKAMTCTYYSRSGEILLSEEIPTPATTEE